MKTFLLAHKYWAEILKPGDTVIDATVGNGHDTLVLKNLLRGQGKIIGYDIQKKALEKARILLGDDPQITLLEASHEHFHVEKAKLIVYNLGYLPGGDKSVTTKTKTTLRSLESAVKILEDCISITCYPGHEEGEKEEKAILEWAATLPSNEWSVCHHRWINRQKAPSLVLIRRHQNGIASFDNAQL